MMTSTYRSQEVINSRRPNTAGTRTFSIIEDNSPSARQDFKIYRNLEAISVLFLVLSASGVTVFARSLATWQALSAPIILVIFSTTFYYLYSIKISYRIVSFLLAFLALTAVQSLIYDSIHPKHLLLYPVNFLCSYCLVKAMGPRFFGYVETQIFALATISIAIWTLDTLTSGAVSNGLKGITVGTPYDDIVDSYVVVQTFINEGVDAFLRRNSGFCWEPGAFSVMCNAALMLNAYRTKFRIQGNVRAVVLTMAIITSQSTTGFYILFIFALIRLWHTSSRTSRLFVWPVMAIFLLLASVTLPFMQSKIKEVSEQSLNEVAKQASQDWNKDKPIAAQRFLSFTMDFSDFLNNPLTGYGGEDSQMMAKRSSYNIVSVSGIGKVLARFGILGFAFFIIATAYSSLYVNRYFKAGSPSMLFLFILLTSISYSIIEHPLFICLWCFGFFAGATNFMRALK